MSRAAARRRLPLAFVPTVLPRADRSLVLTTSLGSVALAPDRAADLAGSLLRAVDRGAADARWRERTFTPTHDGPALFVPGDEAIPLAVAVLHALAADRRT